MGHHAGIFGGAIDHFVVAAAAAAAAHIIGIAVAAVMVKGHPPGIFLANAIVLAQILGRPVRVVQHPANLAQNVAGKVPLSQIEVPLLHLPFCVSVVVVAAVGVVELPILMLLLLFWRRRLGLRQWRRRRGGKR